MFADKFLHLICSHKRNNWIQNSNDKKGQKGLGYHRQAALLAAVMESSALEVAASLTSDLHTFKSHQHKSCVSFSKEKLQTFLQPELLLEQFFSPETLAEC